MVAARETATQARRLVWNACQKQGIEPGQLTLHQDRGALMTAKTLKYAPDYPGRFATPETARAWCRPFFEWYNTEHRHSGLGLLTPDAVHQGRAHEIQKARQGVLDEAYATRPERFVNGPPQAPEIPTEVWINQPHNTIECGRISKLSHEVSHSS